MSELDIRKLVVIVDQVFHTPSGGITDRSLRKVAACAVFRNPFAGRGHVEDLAELIEASAHLGAELGRRCVDALDDEVQSYGKSGIVGVNGEQEHLQASVTSVFGDAFRQAIGGGAAWITSTGKVGGPGTAVDVPLAFKDDIWVRSHYDTITVQIADAPLPDELVVIAAVANRGRLDARVGGRTREEALAGGVTG